jgi:hypothetical protein
VRADKLTGSVLLISKTLLVLASFAGLVGWTYLTLLSLAWAGSRMGVSDALLLAFPFVYLLCSVGVCFAGMRKRTLVILGACLNLPLVITGLYFIFKSPESVTATGICFAFILLWSFMCLAYAHADETAA